MIHLCRAPFTIEYHETKTRGIKMTNRKIEQIKKMQQELKVKKKFKEPGARETRRNGD